MKLFFAKVSILSILIMSSLTYADEYTDTYQLMSIFTNGHPSFKKSSCLSDELFKETRHRAFLAIGCHISEIEFSGVIQKNIKYVKADVGYQCQNLPDSHTSRIVIYCKGK